MSSEPSGWEQEDGTAVPRRIAAILRKGLNNSDYLGPEGKRRWKDEVRSAATQPLFDAIQSKTKETELRDLQFKLKGAPAGKTRLSYLDAMETKLSIPLEPHLSLFVRVGETDDEKLFEDKLIWGFGMWGKEATARQYMAADLEAFAPLDSDERKRVFKPGDFGGASFEVVHLLSPDELEATDLEGLVERICTDLERRYTLLMDHQAEIVAQLAPQPDPPAPPGAKAGKSSVQGLLSGAALANHLSSQGLRFTRTQVATYLTALQTKGFVILSGLSGTGKTKLAQAVVELLPPPHNGCKLCFQSVRPDWRDSKSLLGYFNPLTRTYESTEFLRFILQADAEYREHGENAAPQLVLLDEMNLARVEYYFADFLSVMESGRDENGYTREPVRFTYPNDAQGELPAAELRLPPNLYITGTVNVDETTHTFSPKVLDRAFTIEFGDVNFEGYPPAWSAMADWPDEAQETLRQAFTRQGRFAVVDKAIIRDFTQNHPEVRRRLQALIALLTPHGMGFGYRVFDEIVAFLHNALTAPWRDGFGNNDDQVLDAALDEAVRMKVLPKFHGPTGKLAEPLLAVLAWAENPEAPDQERIDALRGQWEERTRIDPAKFICSETASKAGRMLQTLRDTGFASFA